MISETDVTRFGFYCYIQTTPRMEHYRDAFFALREAIEQWLVCRDVATVQDMNEASGGQRIKI